MTNNFPANLRFLRKKHNFTQKQLSELVNKKESTVRMWELGKSEPSMTTLIKISSVFKVTLDELVEVIE